VTTCLLGFEGLARSPTFVVCVLAPGREALVGDLDGGEVVFVGCHGAHLKH
jgi:hypothetical protein